MKRTVLFLLLTAGAFLLGRYSRAEPESPQHHMNDLIRVGFTMSDPEGNEIAHWDE